ncbi:MAG: FtsX-like permease family protein, partial [Bacteroidetes bacterium]|nr:FtsX-like permease family protein [Bacteroidota bacterium]
GSLISARIETVRLFTLIAILVVLIACINFINLSTARSEKRAREVGVRKIMGAYNGSLIAQFLVESTLLVMLAFSIALLLVGLSLPLFNQVMETSLHLELFQFQFWLYAVVIILLTGLLAGSYPAFILSLHQPAKALKGAFSRIKGAVDPRKLLVVVQFTAAITLSISAVVVQGQIKYAQDRRPGYDPENIAYEFLQGKIPLHFEAIKNELIASGAVTSVTRTFSPIVRIWNNATGLTWQGSNDADKTTNFLLFGADADMSTTFATRILQGRDLDIYLHPGDTAAVLLNEAAVKAMRMDNPIGEMLRDSDGMNWQVVGVVQDFIMESPYNKISPMIIQGWRDRYGVINYRFNTENSYADNVKKAEMVFKTNNPEYPFECISAQSNYLRKFRLEVQTGTLASWFAGLTILISCLGLFGLATYLAESRTKEVGVRKVLGATTFQITSMLSLGFVKLVVISIVIGTPAAWYIADNWLQSYDYRTPLNLWIFLLMGLIAILIALITVSTQAIKAAMMKPVKSLRNE